MRIFLIALALLFATVKPVWAANSDDADQVALNQQYQQFINAFAALDPQRLVAIYADDATYIPEQQNVAIVTGKNSIVELYQKFFDRIRKRKAHIEVDFRLVKRLIQGNSATDVCYYLVRFHPPAETEEPVSEFAGKMVTVSEKNAQGVWQWKVDISNRAEPQHFFDAPPKPNLYYGHHFSPLTK
ncbi:nuclear transport factor 2 family protein [Shewanella yunxiaonensis]|uniref:Nuclear transport factor 2 family protein n=1 Tax=Shewanella yunxiaonensis TaxID=2829809 RepID=A0ABX7YP07_9GAMM|nr:nuclear transport factor 2 family protein [Shewanella yunxiaonensis]QUN04497.1 nuclear transport factor 2 family protein [Shewanella yunxiaonensis]